MASVRIIYLLKTGGALSLAYGWIIAKYLGQRVEHKLYIDLGRLS